ncbi:hypothetical protein [Kitasatospora sp. NPDC056184]|uniref:hypothetical protein n=1 Tax=Kitasatospora sp. NPDC056184 TaxID=3345738 RepID=UPI0035E02B7F
MAELLWEDVRDLFDPDLMGALPDLEVADTSVADWQALFDLVGSMPGWSWRFADGPVGGPLPSAGAVFARSSDVDEVLRVWPVPGVEVVFRPWSEEVIDFDVDLRELQGQAGADTLCGLLSTIGRRLGRPVTMAAEGDLGYPVLGYDPVADRVSKLVER